MKPIVVRVVFFLVSYCTIVASSVAAMDLQRKFAKSYVSRSVNTGVNYYIKTELTQILE